MQPATSTVPKKDAPQPTRTRLISLDICRGLAVAGMILVDNPGSDELAFGPIKHAEWNGWTPADLIFPTFLFLVGVSIVLAFSARLARGESRRQIFVHAMKRAAILFAIGVVINGFPAFELAGYRIYGVLQRIAVCYLIAAALVLWSDWRWQLATAAACLVGYWVLMRFVPVPGFGVPGQDIPFTDPYRNLTAWIDRQIFMGRLYNQTRDPEGLLSTIPSIATALLGVLTGHWLRSLHTPATKAARMLGFGLLGLGAGLILDRVLFPINKNLWSSSFVIFAGGFTLVLLSVLYWIVEIRNWRGRWTMVPLVFGMNAIAGFVADALVYGPGYSFHVEGPGGATMRLQQYIYAQIFSVVPMAPVASLIYSVAAVCFAWFLLWLLYRKRIFVKI